MKDRCNSCSTARPAATRILSGRACSKGTGEVSKRISRNRDFRNLPFHKRRGTHKGACFIFYTGSTNLLRLDDLGGHAATAAAWQSPKQPSGGYFKAAPV